MGKVKTNEISTKTFFLSTYCSVDFVQEVLGRKIQQIKSYAYILHDKDVYLADVVRDGELVHHQGETEIEHVHIYLELYYSRKPTEIIGWFKCLDDEGRMINTFKEIPFGCQSCIDYLTHKWNPEKFQYSPLEIVSYGLNRLQDGSLVANDDCDFTYDIIQSLMQGESLKTLIKRYGKDFVYHYRQYKDIVSDLLDLKRLGYDFRGQIERVVEPVDGKLPF